MSTLGFTITQLIKENTVHFKEYREGELYYNINYFDVPNSTIFTYVFKVPTEDAGKAIFKNVDKAIYFMRYIRKGIEDGTFALESRALNVLTLAAV